MSVKLVRIDDRLIHGQIVTAWIKEAKASAILVADDIAANDPTQSMLLKLTTPKNTKLYIKGLKDSVDSIKNNEIKEDVFMLIRNPENAYKLLEYGLDLSDINLGNVSNSKSETGRKTILPFLHLEENDVNFIRKLDEAGVNLDVRAVPSDKSINAIELINKKYK